MFYWYNNFIVTVLSVMTLLALVAYLVMAGGVRQKGWGLNLAEEQDLYYLWARYLYEHSGRDQTSKPFWHGPHVPVDIWDRTQCPAWFSVVLQVLLQEYKVRKKRYKIETEEVTFILFTYGMITHRENSKESIYQI